VYEFALGFMVCTDLVFLLAGYMYVYKPWQVMRRDIVALNTEVKSLGEKLAQELQLRKVINRSDSDLAKIEADGSLRRILRDVEYH
jgi:hypothetical protein